MRCRCILLHALMLGVVACGGQNPLSPTPAPTTSTTTATLTGTWIGSGMDSSGSMMGTGANTVARDAVTWTLTQTGSSFTGHMNVPGMMMGSRITVSGTLNGHSGTFTVAVPSGSMMANRCSATASGSFEMDDKMTEFHSTYAGTNSCSGPFALGELHMHR